MSEFGLLNWTIVFAYLIGILVLGFFLSKRIETDQDYYLGRKTTPWWAISLSLLATYLSVLGFLGGSAWSYTEGIAVAIIHINYPLVVFIVITIFLPFFYNSGVASIFDYLERRFGVKARTFMSSVFLFGTFIYSGILLYTTALVLEFITGIPVTTAILIVAIVALTYTILGGITAVIWTDFVQAVVLIIGAVLVLYFVVAELPASMQSTLAAMKTEGRTSPFDFSLDTSKVATIWTGLVAMTIYHVVVFGINQMLVQRTLAAKSLADAKKAYVLVGYVAFLATGLFFVMGALLHSYYDGRVFENTNVIVLEFVASIGIPGLMGILTAAIAAAAMSSLDSSLNSAATVITIDFYKAFFKKDGTPEHYLKASRWFTIICAVVIVIPAFLYTKGGGSVLEILSKVGSFLVGAKLAMFGLGFFSKHTTERGLLVGVVVGFLSLWYLESSTEVAWPWYCVVGSVVSISVSWLSSIAFDGFQPEYSEYTVKGQKELFKRENREEKKDGWFVVPGRIDKVSYFLLGYLALCLVAWWWLEGLI